MTPLVLYSYTLFQFGADPDLKTSDCWTPLMIACHNGQLNVVELLLKAKVDVNPCLENGATKIYNACHNGHSGVISKLLQFGADPKLNKRNGSTPFT